MWKSFLWCIRQDKSSTRDDDNNDDDDDDDKSLVTTDHCKSTISDGQIKGI